MLSHCVLYYYFRSRGQGLIDNAPSDINLDLPWNFLSILHKSIKVFSLERSNSSQFNQFDSWVSVGLKVEMLFVCLRYVKVPMGNMGVFDPTEIHNRGQLKSHMKEAMIKLGYHLLCFFIYLYRYTSAASCETCCNTEGTCCNWRWSVCVCSMILALINDWDVPTLESKCQFRGFDVFHFRSIKSWELLSSFRHIHFNDHKINTIIDSGRTVG